MAEEVEAALKSAGHAGAAAQLTNAVPLPLAVPEAPAAAPRRALPAKCPHCAGAVRSDEVDWIDDASAECLYCGGVIQATG
jgi:hypothetical protein